MQSMANKEVHKNFIMSRGNKPVSVATSTTALGLNF